jgi:hypothetical protein
LQGPVEPAGEIGESRVDADGLVVYRDEELTSMQEEHSDAVRHLYRVHGQLVDLIEHWTLAELEELHEEKHRRYEFPPFK